MSEKNKLRMGMLRRRQGQCRAIFYPMSVSGRPKYRERDGHEKNTEKCDLEGTDGELCLCMQNDIIASCPIYVLVIASRKTLHGDVIPSSGICELGRRGVDAQNCWLCSKEGTMHLLFAWRNVAHSRLCCVLFAVCYCVFFFRGYG